MKPSPYGLSIEQRQQNILQMALYGTILNFWANTELLIEMVIKDTLKLSTREVCILCGPLGAGAKVNLVRSLLAETGDRPDFAQALVAFQAIVGRNALAHGFVTYEQIDQPWDIVSREVREKLVVKTKSLKRYLDDDVVPAFDRVVEASGFTDDDHYAYGREVAALARDA